MTRSAITWECSINSFLQQAGSPSPTPGGGSVAALAAALGASMTSMVAHLSQGERFASIASEVAAAITDMKALTAEGERLMQADIASFNHYMAALKLPKGTEEERTRRLAAIHQAAIQAIDIPLRLMDLCKQGMSRTHSLAEASNKNVASDLAIGAIQLEAAAQSAAITIEINLASLRDDSLARQYRDKLTTLLQDMTELKQDTLSIVRRRMQE